MVEIKMVELEIPTAFGLRALASQACEEKALKAKTLEERSWDNFPYLIQGILEKATQKAKEGFVSCEINIADCTFTNIDPRIDYVFNGEIQYGMIQKIEEVLTEAGYKVQYCHRLSKTYNAYRSMEIGLCWA